MPADTFTRYRESRRTGRRLIFAGVSVIALALLAAITAYFFRPSPSEPEPFSLPSAHDGTGGSFELDAEPDSAAARGMFYGSLSEEGSPEGAWTAVAALTGQTGIVTYPDQNCQVYLFDPVADGSRVSFDAETLVGRCEAEGTWAFESTGNGLRATYTPLEPAADAALVLGTLTAE
ncbi:hypothetical protein [Corynebacterium sp. HMSC04H06]|uniref:hypothetical protein n=1 Tax=Corynebacterium sp. HMSC04H06 TaxID=1581050 RepID=UPI0008A28994|nr:hypothetical protein [Corynebacterium sp. HMSC04H06]OFS23513.1 hypothetical protein HMPREF3067_01230 [Corynebacterium sp. HMSC04H06]